MCTGTIDCVIKACEGASVLETGIRALRSGGTYVWSKPFDNNGSSQYPIHYALDEVSIDFWP